MAFLIDDLLLLPAKGFIGIFKKIHEVAKKELEDTPEKLQRELLDLQMALEAEQIIGSEYQKKEKNILERMEVLKKRSV